MKEKRFGKKEQLLEIAIKEFAEKGYDNSSLNNILKETGISKGTFYYHFKNKEDLYAYIISILIEEKKNFLQKNFNAEIYKQDIFSILKNLTNLGLEFARSNPQINKFAESFMKEKDNEIYHKMINKFASAPNTYEYIDNLIEISYQRGEIREDLPKDFVKRIVSYLFLHISEIANVVRLEDFEDISDILIKFIKSGLEKK